MIQDAMSEKKVWGRPTKYDPKYCDEIVEFMSDGSSLTGFAAHIMVTRETVYEWERKHPDFSDAIKVARQKSQEWWEKAGKSGLFMGKEDGTFSQSAWIFNMKARFGYRDKVEVEQKTEQTIKLAYSLEEDEKE